VTDDIVTRLRHVAWLAEEGSDVTDLAATAADEIVRLRDAGNQLHAWVTVNATSIQQERVSHDKVLTAWEEACRG